MKQRPFLFLMAFVLLFCLVAGRPAAAECETDRVIRTEPGILSVYLHSPCRAGQQAVLMSEGRDYLLRFNREGLAYRAIAVLTPMAEFLLRLDGSEAQPITVAMPPLDKTTLVVLRWETPSALELHVVEPGGKLLGEGDNNPHTPSRKVRGRMIDASTVDSGWREQIYALTSGEPWPVNTAGIFVDFLDRADPPEAPFCGDDPMASPAFEVAMAFGGTVRRPQRISMAAVPCGTPLTQSQRYLRIRP